MSLFDLAGLDKKTAALLENYAQKFVEIYGDNLRSIVLYGSAVSESLTKHSNINLLFIFKKLNVSVLNKALKPIEKGRHKKILAPLFLTEEHIRTSMDSFPMEFSEIKSRHRVLYGADIFSSIEIDNKNLRIQCEQQAKSLLIKIRQSYLEIGLHKKELENLLHQSFRSVLPVMRAVLVLLGHEPVFEKKALIEKVSNEAGVEASVFIDLFTDDAGDGVIGNLSSIEFFDKYLAELEKLANFIDKINS